MEIKWNCFNCKYTNTSQSTTCANCRHPYQKMSERPTMTALLIKDAVYPSGRVIAKALDKVKFNVNCGIFYIFNLNGELIYSSFNESWLYQHLVTDMPIEWYMLEH